MTKVIAYCTSGQPFLANRIFEESVAERYPGALGVKRLQELAQARGYEVMTGDVAIERVSRGALSASDVLIVQEEAAADGIQLASLGAVQLAILCLESPMFATRFYSKLTSYVRGFRTRMLFRGALTGASGDLVAYFPSHDMAFDEPVTWGDRKFLVMVAGNKYHLTRRPPHFTNVIRHVVRSMRTFREREIRDLVRRFQLHDERLHLIEYFGGNERLDLYGPGWNSLSNLPEAWQRRLSVIASSANRGRCEDKHKVISRYKFAICFENMAFPGYVTEKVVDCLRAGVIPIYLGAPDISDFVDEAAYVDYRRFGSVEQLDQWMNLLTEKEATLIIGAGRRFLQSPAGAQFSYNHFARTILDAADTALF